MRNKVSSVWITSHDFTIFGGFTEKSLEARGILLGVPDDLHSRLCPGRDVLGQLHGDKAANGLTTLNMLNNNASYAYYAN